MTEKGQYNYYYFGRRPYPVILAWMTLALIFCVGSILFFLVTLSLLNQSTKSAEDLQTQEYELLAKTAGTRLETAMKGAKNFKRDLGLKRFRENFYEALVKNANFPMYLYHDLMTRIENGTNLEEVQRILEENHIEGLKAKISNEERLIKLYQSFLNGVSDLDEYDATMAKKPYLPVAIKELINNPKYDIATGIKPFLSDLQGEFSNLNVTVLELEEKEKKLASTVVEKSKERDEVFPELKKELMIKNTEFQKTTWQNLTSQKEAWNRFIKKTKTLSEERRKEDINIYNAESELGDVRKLMDNKVKGQDWIPPLDLVDGSVISINKTLNVVMLDIGRKHGLRPGQHFDILNVKGDVIQSKKGRVVVRKLMSDMSIAAILEENPDNPFYITDKVADGKFDKPFDKKITPNYAFEGTFFTGLSFGFMNYLIKISGGKISSEVDKNTKYIILGKNPDKETIQLCKKLGVRAIRQQNLAEHLGISQDELNELKKQKWN